MDDSLATDGTTKYTITPVPYIHITRTIPYRLAKLPPPFNTNFTCIIQNLQTYINTKYHKTPKPPPPNLHMWKKWLSIKDFILSSPTISRKNPTPNWLPNYTTPYSDLPNTWATIGETLISHIHTLTQTAQCALTR